MSDVQGSHAPADFEDTDTYLALEHSLPDILSW